MHTDGVKKTANSSNNITPKLETALGTHSPLQMSD